jgi:hypothetical protein
MPVIEIPREIDRFVLYFDTPKRQINAYALATSLIGLSDAVRAANAAVNPGYHVEVVVEALGDGSFQAVIRTIFEKTRDLFSNEAVKAIVYGIIATHIYEVAIKTDTPTKITVSPDVVVIESGKEKIIVPRDVYEAKRQLEKSERFTSAIGQVFHGAQSDHAVKGLGLKTNPDKSPPPIYIPRDKFAIFDSRNVEEGSREIIEFATLEISRVILARGKRKWEFYWRGMRISAPVLDVRFYDRFFAREITIAPGDGLRVALRIVQAQSPDTGIFVNEKYEVVEVFEHIPRMQQDGL